MPARLSMTTKQRTRLLVLPTTEEEVVRHHSLDANDLAAIREARTPETRLGYALQLCALRYPGRHLRRGELVPAIMLDHIAEQVGVDGELLAAFGRRAPTRYAQLDTIKRRHGFRDMTRPTKAEIMGWLIGAAIGITDGPALLDRLLNHMRAQRIVIPGLSVVERMAAEAMNAADAQVIGAVAALLGTKMRADIDAIVSDKAHARQSRLSWLREPPARVGAATLIEILDKLDRVRMTGVPQLALADAHRPRLAQMAREGVRLTAQAFQQMWAERRHAMLVATLRDLEATLTDAAIAMFGSLVGRANLRAKKRLEETIAASADQGRERLIRIAKVLEAVARTARTGGDIAAAVAKVASLDVIEADAALIRRTTKPGRADALGELGPEYKVFKQVGHRFLAAFTFEGRASTAPLRAAMAVLVALGGDGRKALPADVPLGHLERRWHRHVIVEDKLDRTYWELATYFAVASGLAAGDLWVPTSRLHRSLDVLLAPATTTPSPIPSLLPAVRHGSAAEWLDARAAELDAALLDVAHGLKGGDTVLFAGDKLRFPKDPKGDDAKLDPGKRFASLCYGMLQPTRVTDMIEQVDRWTGFTEHFRHVSTGLPPTDKRAFFAALIAEATNLGLSRMADVCSVASRRALIRMQTWHMREDTFRPGLACMTDFIHAEPVSRWFGEGWRASADGQAFYLGGPGEAGGTVNAHYGRDPIVKIYTTITDRYAPLHQTVIAGTAGEAIHALDGILGHDSGVDLSALHVDGGGVSDIVFAVMHLLGLSFEPRIPRLSDRRLYAFEPRARYGQLAPLFGPPLDRELITGHWDDIGRAMEAMRNKAVTPSLILKKLSAYSKQNSLAAALREVGRVYRTLFTLRWFKDPALRALVTAELNKGEARNTLARAVAFHRLGRFRDRGLENQQTRAAALNLVTAAIVLFNCRYLDRAIGNLRAQGKVTDESLISKLSPLGWDHINLTGDYVWSDALALDADGFMPLREAS